LTWLGSGNSSPLEKESDVDCGVNEKDITEDSRSWTNAGSGYNVYAMKYETASGVSTASLYVNGVSVATSSVDAIQGVTYTDMHLALSRRAWYTNGWLLGNMGEFMFYDSALSDSDMSGVNSYLSTKFGLTTTPEPSSIVVLCTGLLGLLAYAWRKRR
jgi:hypothetical protein